MAAIYQWFVEDLQVFTTNLYALEVFEELQLGVSLQYGFMTEVPQEHWDAVISCLDGSIRAALITIPTKDEDWDAVISCLDGSIRIGLITAPTQDEDWDAVISCLDGTVVPSIVQALMPDEGLHFGCSLVSGSMTHV